MYEPLTGAHVCRIRGEREARASMLLIIKRFSSKNLDRRMLYSTLLSSKYHETFKFGLEFLRCLSDFKCIEIQHYLHDFR